MTEEKRWEIPQTIVRIKDVSARPDAPGHKTGQVNIDGKNVTVVAETLCLDFGYRDMTRLTVEMPKSLVEFGGEYGEQPFVNGREVLAAKEGSDSEVSEDKETVTLVLLPHEIHFDH